MLDFTDAEADGCYGSGNVNMPKLVRWQALWALRPLGEPSELRPCSNATGELTVWWEGPTLTVPTHAMSSFRIVFQSQFLETEQFGDEILDFTRGCPSDNLDCGELFELALFQGEYGFETDDGDSFTMTFVPVPG